MDSNADSNGIRVSGVHRCSPTSSKPAGRARIGHRGTRTDHFDDTGGQVVAGANPVSPTGTFRSFFASLRLTVEPHAVAMIIEWTSRGRQLR